MTTLRIPQARTLQKLVINVQANAKTRCLEPRDVVKAREAFRAFLRYCEKNNLQSPSLYLDGGAVANSYKYRADSTVFERASSTSETKRAI